MYLLVHAYHYRITWRVDENWRVCLPPILDFWWSLLNIHSSSVFKVLPEATTIHLHVRVENMMCSIQNSPEKKTVNAYQIIPGLFLSLARKRHASMQNEWPDPLKKYCKWSCSMHHFWRCKNSICHIWWLYKGHNIWNYNWFCNVKGKLVTLFPSICSKLNITTLRCNVGPARMKGGQHWTALKRCKWTEFWPTSFWKAASRHTKSGKLMIWKSW